MAPYPNTRMNTNRAEAVDRKKYATTQPSLAGSLRQTTALPPVTEETTTTSPEESATRASNATTKGSKRSPLDNPNDLSNKNIVAPPKISSSVLHETVLTSGNDFYDDGYNEVELETDVPHTLFNGGGTEVFGRDEELKLLRTAFDQMVAAGEASRRGRPNKTASQPTTSVGSAAPASTPTPTSPFVGEVLLPAAFVWGISGTGKSKLVDTFCNQLRDDLQKENRKRNRKKTSRKAIAHRDVHILKGKFEEHQQGDPFSAITQAISNWCKQLASHRKPAASTAKHSMPSSPPLTLSSVEPSGLDHVGAKITEDTTSQQETQSIAPNLLVQQLRSNIKSSLLTSEQKGLLLTFVPALSILFDDGDSGNTSLASSSLHQINSTPNAESNAPKVSSTDTSWNRFQYTFAQFLSAVSSKDCPVVMVLDDLQWASQECMELMSTAMHRSHFLWIGTIRQEVNPHSPDEVVELGVDVPFRMLLADINLNNPASNTGNNTNSSNGKQTTVIPPYTDIHLNNFTQQQLRDWVSELFQQDDDVVDEASNLLFRQTDGNIFHAVQLLEDMERSQVLVYSRITFQWEMNTAACASASASSYVQGGINSGTSTTELSGLGGSSHIIQLISSKLRCLPTQLQKALVLASYIRSSFELELLQVVWDYELQHNPTNDDILGGSAISSSDCNNNDSTGHNNDPSTPLVEWLEQAVLEGLLANSIGGTSYRFSHDRIQQAAHDLVPFGEVRTMLRLRIGQCLWNVCTDYDSSKGTLDDARESDGGLANESSDGNVVSDDSGLIFIAADHLNCTPSKDHLLSTQRNLMVGEHALHLSALVPAATYLQLANTSLRKLRGDPWQDHYDLTLRLLRARCDIELSLNHFDLGYSVGDDLLEHARSLDDKLPTYAVMANALAKEDKHQSSLQLSQRGAQLCGEYPKRGYAFRIVRELVAARAYFRKTDDEKFFHRNPVTDGHRTLLSMNFLRQVIIRGSLCQDPLSGVLAILLMVRITRRDGICEDSASAMNAFGMLHVVLGDAAGARRYATLAKKILHAVESYKRLEGWIYFSGAMYIESYFKSPAQIAHDYQHAYTAAMSVGDFEVGFLAWNASLLHAYLEGYPLPALIHATNDLFQQIKAFKIDAHTHMISEHTSAYCYMRGTRELEWDRIMDIDKYKTKDPYHRNAAYWVRLHIAVYFRKFEYAEVLYQTIVKDGFEDQGYNHLTFLVTMVGLMASNRYRQSKKRRYLVTLRQQKQQLKRICNTRGDNALHRYLILRAEMKAIKVGGACFAVAESYYNTAIARAEEGHRLHEAGFACELAGEHFLAVDGIRQEQRHRLINNYFTKAMGFYEAWGSIAKTKILLQLRGEFINQELVRATKRKSGIVAQAKNITFGDQMRSQQPGYQSSVSYDLMSASTPVNTLAHTVASMVSIESSGKSPLGDRSSADSRNNSTEGPDDDLSVLTDMS